MSILSVFHTASPELAHKVLTHHEDIVATLAEQGVHFARWASGARLRPGCAEQEVLEACRVPLDGLMTERGSNGFRLLNHDGVAPALAALGEEHSLDTEEVLAMVSGRVQVSLHIGDYVYAVLCEKDEVLQIPAGTPRWLSFGDIPFCLALRLYADAQKAQAKQSSEGIAGRFAGMDEL